MTVSISVLIVQLAGNHADGFLSHKYGSDLQSAVFDSISNEYPDASVSVLVDTRDKTSGVTPEPIISVDGADEYEISKNVQNLIEHEQCVFGGKCMQDENYFTEELVQA